MGLDVRELSRDDTTDASNRSAWTRQRTGSKQQDEMSSLTSAISTANGPADGEGAVAVGRNDIVSIAMSIPGHRRPSTLGIRVSAFRDDLINHERRRIRIAPHNSRR
jgi:hypothetical protein